MVTTQKWQKRGILPIGASPTMLVLDIEEATLVAPKRVPQDAGFDATTTWDQSEAISLLNSISFDLLLIGHHTEVKCEEFLRSAGRKNLSQACIVLKSTTQSFDHTCQISAVVSKHDFSAIVQQARSLITSNIRESDKCRKQ